MTIEAPITYQDRIADTEKAKQPLTLGYVDVFQHAHEMLEIAIKGLDPRQRLVQRNEILIRPGQGIAEMKEWQQELRDLSARIVGLGASASEEAVRSILIARRDALQQEIERTPNGVIETSPSAIGGKQRKSFLAERANFLELIMK